MLLTGEEVVVVGEQHAVNGELPIAPAVISEVLRPGHDVLIDDGLVRLARRGGRRRAARAAASSSAAR